MINEQCLDVFPNGKPTAVSKSFTSSDICDITSATEERMLCYSSGLVELYDRVAEPCRLIVSKLGENVQTYELKRKNEVFVAQIPPTIVSLISKRWDYTGEGATTELLRVVDEVCGSNLEVRNLVVNFWGINPIVTPPSGSERQRRFIHISFEDSIDDQSK